MANNQSILPNLVMTTLGTNSRQSPCGLCALNSLPLYEKECFKAITHVYGCADYSSGMRFYESNQNELVQFSRFTGELVDTHL